MTTAANCPFLPPGYDFTDPDVLVEGIPVDEFAQLVQQARIVPGEKFWRRACLFGNKFQGLPCRKPNKILWF